MAVDNDHARSKHPRQGSTPASHVWTRQPKAGLSIEEPDLEQSYQHLPISFMSGFESRATFMGMVPAQPAAAARAASAVRAAEPPRRCDKIEFAAGTRMRLH